MQPIKILPTIIAVAAITSIITAWLIAKINQKRSRQTSNELSNLNEVGRQLLRTQLNVDDLCELVYWQTGQIIPAGLFQLGLFKGDAYHVKVWVRDSVRQEKTVFPEGGTKGVIGWVREAGEPLLIRDFEAERDSLPAFPEFELDHPPRSGLFVPLITETSTIGVIAVQSRQVGHFTNEHLSLLTALANQVAWAIRNAQLYEHAQNRAEQLNLIGQVTAQISTIQPLPDLFKQIVSLTKETFGYYCVNIFIIEGQTLQIAASTDESFARRAPALPLGIGMIGWSAQESQTALANNVAEDTRYQRLAFLPETQSEIALPLQVEDRVLGVMDVQSNEISTFTNEDVLLLETLAGQVAFAIEQAQTYDEERRLSERLEALVQVSQALVSILDLDELLDKVVDLISDTFNYERTHIFLRVGNRLVFRAGAGSYSVRWLNEELSYALDSPGLIPAVGRTGETRRVGDITTSKEYRSDQRIDDTRSEMVIPIKMGERVMGVLDLQSEHKDAFTQDDETLIQSLADSVAVAIRNAALYVNERKRRGLAETVRKVSASLASNLELDSVLSGILNGLGRVITIDTAAILLMDDDLAALTITTTTGDELGEVTGKTIKLQDLEFDTDSRFDDLVMQAYHQLIPEQKHLTSMIAPLLVQNDLLGYLIANHHNPTQYSVYDREVILIFASQVAIAINNARLYAAQQAEAWVTTALLQVAEAVNAQVEVQESLETIARLTSLLASINKCMILNWSVDDKTFILTAQSNLSKEQFRKAKEKPLLAEDHPYLDLLSVADRWVGAGEGYPLSIPKPIADLMEVPSLMGLMLRAKQEPVGLLLVDDPSEGKETDPRLRNILTGIAHQAATALDTAALQASAAERERLEQEIQVAREIQSSLLPDQLPEIDGWQIAAAWRAARQVSGDFYDFIPLPNNKWGVVIADVADKGIPAALFMALCRTLLRASAINRISPAATLSRVNQLLLNDSSSDLFVTVFYAVWEPDTGILTYANGGHNPSLLIREKDKQIVELKAKGIALGIIEDITLEESEFKMAPGDALIAYTDGITEAMQSDYTEWGMARFKEMVKSGQGKSAKVMLDTILNAIDTFVGGATQSDDITLWVLRRTKEVNKKAET